METLSEPMDYLSGFVLSGSLMASVSKDATSQKYVPATSTEWSRAVSVSSIPGSPSNLWLCQEASGNLADTLGAVPLVVAGTPSYQQAQTGWTRKAVAITATTVQAFAASGAGPNAATSSVAWLAYLALTVTPGGNRNVVYATGSATPLGVDHLSTNKVMIRCGANTTNSLQNYTLTTVWPLLLVYNRTASSVAMYTDQESLTGTFASVTDGVKGIGATQSSGDSGMKVLYLTAWSGANAELSKNNARSLLQTLGWTIPW